ncbi:MAG: PolC-type DNA polymerase III [Limnochordia bacterium]|nr:PolC-type DNA polymerase III [Limnochordia bacterium]HOL99767.1 PolC-type DNA polymerase III [Limnochordia bacterium]HPZ79338.1 PolC-type DNA polymerase III [Limnochordia bacterium]HQE35497.1 PolC-type DNA polymerase III [Limnochordia bacterium]
MTSFYIEPENKFFLASLSSHPLVQELEIARIGVDPQTKAWTFVLKGSPRGEQALWDELSQAVKQLHPEVAEVRFEWTEPEANYIGNAIKQVNGRPIDYGSSPNNGGRNGRSRNLLRASLPGEPTPIAQLVEPEENVIICGEVVAYEARLTRTGKTLIMFDVYDGTDTISCKVFQDDPADLGLKKGQWVKVRGSLQFQPYDNELQIMAQGLAFVEAPPCLTDTAPEKRVELHLHTKMSGLDGTVDVDQLLKLASSLGHDAVAITDHGVVQAFPEAHRAAKKHGIKIIYGVEGYLIDDPESKVRPFHIVLLAKNRVGLKNLYRLISHSNLDHFYRVPRIPRALLQEYREGLIVGSACEAGEVFQAVLHQRPNVLEVAGFYDYLEIQPLANNEFLIGTAQVRSKDDLIRINQQIIKLGERLGIPVVATGDVHFLRPEDAFVRTILLAGKGMGDAEHPAPLYYRTTEEMLQEFSYLTPEKAYEVVVEAPRKIAAQVEELSPVPSGFYPPHLPDAEQELEKMTYAKAKEIYGEPLPEIVQARLARELKAIINHGYASLYLIAHKLVKKSLDDGYLVGSRGSVGSSLVATMCEITEVNPLPPHYVCPSCHWSEFFTAGEAGSGVDLPEKDCPQCGTALNRLGFDIPFEVFMGFHGDKVPDIDLNFSGEYQAQIHSYTEELFGRGNVFRAGTIGTLADKTAYGFIMKYLEQTNETRRNAEINRLVAKLSGVRRTTGQHPGGMVVIPEGMEVYDFTPIQYPANDPASGTITTHFEYHALDDCLVKLDILGHDDPTMLRMLEDLTGVPVLEIPLNDPKTMSIFSSTESLGVTPDQIGTNVGTLGVPEFGTRFVRQMLEDTSPKTFSDLVRISGLSHGTNVWTNNAEELVKAGIVDISGVIATRDDIMIYLMLKGVEAGQAFRIMEQVRKGRGLTPEDETLLKQYDVPQWYIDSCKKISYMFPKAHAVAYVMMAFRIAYFKVHHPLAFYAALFSLQAGDFDAQLVMGGEEAVRAELARITNKSYEATPKERSMVTLLEIIIEAMARGVRFLPVDLYKSAAQTFLIEGSALRLPFASLQGVGASAATGIVQAREAGEFISVEDLRQRAGITKAVIEALRLHGCLEGLPETNQLTLF